MALSASRPPPLLAAGELRLMPRCQVAPCITIVIIIIIVIIVVVIIVKRRPAAESA